MVKKPVRLIFNVRLDSVTSDAGGPPAFNANAGIPTPTDLVHRLYSESVRSTGAGSQRVWTYAVEEVTEDQFPDSHARGLQQAQLFADALRRIWDALPDEDRGDFVLQDHHQPSGGQEPPWTFGTGALVVLGQRRGNETLFEFSMEGEGQSAIVVYEVGLMF